MGLKKAYLIAYNAASAAAWGVVLVQVISIGSTKGPVAVGLALDEYARITQTFAIMEILHSLTGVVPAPLFTTVMQVFSRLILVWGICKPFPELNASPFYSSMMLAYGMTEVIRYGYFVMKLAGALPYALNWLRYSAFLVLYPLGITSEYALLIMAYRGPAEDLFTWYPWAVAACLAIWPPSAYILYTHMLRQRRKYLGGGSKAKKTKKTK